MDQQSHISQSMGGMQSFALPRATGSLEQGSHGTSLDSSGSFECGKSECAKGSHGPSVSLVN